MDTVDVDVDDTNQLEQLLCSGGDNLLTTTNESWDVILHSLFKIDDATVLIPVEVDALYLESSNKSLSNSSCQQHLPIEIKHTLRTTYTVSNDK